MDKQEKRRCQVEYTNVYNLIRTAWDRTPKTNSAHYNRQILCAFIEKFSHYIKKLGILHRKLDLD